MSRKPSIKSAKIHNQTVREQFNILHMDHTEFLEKRKGAEERAQARIKRALRFIVKG